VALFGNESLVQARARIRRASTLSGDIDMKLEEKEEAALKDLLKASDALCSAVISGNAGQMQLALSVARVLGDIKKHSLFKGA